MRLAIYRVLWDWVNSVMNDPGAWLTANLPLVESAIAFVCRKYRFTPDDAEELASIVKLRLVDHDYVVLQAWEGRSSLRAYLVSVVSRMALDYRNQQWGKWYASAEAKRLGALAVALEVLLVREGRTFEEAVVHLVAQNPAVTRESLLALAVRLPVRAPRPHDVELGKAASIPAPEGASPEEQVRDQERRELGKRVASAMTRALRKLPEEDLVINQLRFEQGMSIPKIARALHLEERHLYYRLQCSQRDLGEELRREGISASDVADLIGRDEELIHFDFVKRNPHPSKQDDETEAGDPEDPQ